jgi:lysophospholipase L1-like esterase
VETVREVNRRFAALAAADPQVAYIDVFSKMLGPDGLPLPDIFVQDRLHMNEKGYAIWKEVVRPYLN